ncbi:unnamed protein product [Prorocentrum cordatum]|uniref:Uncharacterized protein n=1 Tax=Prorocentrum cordatum TaxID=2364126 RepID=A0ABN9XMG5_9DINO|nr:unnamed protein product [Polarella glacialis]
MRAAPPGAPAPKEGSSIGTDKKASTEKDKEEDAVPTRNPSVPWRGGVTPGCRRDGAARLWCSQKVQCCSTPQHLKTCAPTIASRRAPGPAHTEQVFHRRRNAYNSAAYNTRFQGEGGEP